jgi:hypothetical protein
MRELRITLVVIHTYVFQVGIFLINYAYMKFLDTCNDATSTT